MNNYITKLFNLFVCIFLFCISFACINEGSAADNLINISDAYSVDLYQSLENIDSELIINLTTIEEYECTNFFIETAKSVENETTVIEFVNILSPETCQIGQGPASTEVILSNDQISEQNITFRFNDEIYDEAILTNTRNTVQFEFKSNYGIKSYISLLHKIPNNSIVCLFETSDQNLASQIVTYIEQLKETGLETVLTDGYYGYFIVEDSEYKSKESTQANIFGIHLSTLNLSEENIESLLSEIEQIKEKLDSNIELSVLENL